MIKGYRDTPVEWKIPPAEIYKKKGWTHQIEYLLPDGSITFQRLVCPADKKHVWTEKFGIEGYLEFREWEIEEGFTEAGYVKIVSVVELP